VVTGCLQPAFLLHLPQSIGNKSRRKRKKKGFFVVVQKGSKNWLSSLILQQPLLQPYSQEGKKGGGFQTRDQASYSFFNFCPHFFAAAKKSQGFFPLSCLPTIKPGGKRGGGARRSSPFPPFLLSLTKGGKGAGTRFFPAKQSYQCLRRVFRTEGGATQDVQVPFAPHRAVS